MNAPLSFENTNALWGTFAAETLARLGLTATVISPGSRSAPLTWALARSSKIRCTPVLDERSAIFLALGIAKRTGVPAAVVCTSGTAAANLLPAIIEAREGRVPLLVLTADRPPELRECAAGQAIDQVKLFGQYPRWQVEIGLPEASGEHLRYLRQVLGHAWRRALSPVPGPVHLNLPFREPLAPVKGDGLPLPLREKALALLNDTAPTLATIPRLAPPAAEPLRARLRTAERGVIVAGAGLPPGEATARAVGRVAGALGWPVLADVLSGLREHADSIPDLVTHYDALLASGAQPDFPDFVLQLGELPTSKRLRAWLREKDLPSLIVDSGDRDLDPLRRRAMHAPMPVSDLPEVLAPLAGPLPPNDHYAKKWTQADRDAQQRIEELLRAETSFFEGKVHWITAGSAPPYSAIFLANSMPVRDAEFFWPAGKGGRPVFANRGANGIDGTLSTAFGLAMESGREAIAIVGDLAFLHDTNALLTRRYVKGSLTVVLINNDGGGIFENLPISKFEPPFEEFFATPQQMDFGRLCAAYGVPHRLAKDWEDFRASVAAPPQSGVRVIEVRTDRKLDPLLRRRLLEQDPGKK